MMSDDLKLQDKLVHIALHDMNCATDMRVSNTASLIRILTNPLHLHLK
jgi:hypothetical protein